MAKLSVKTRLRKEDYPDAPEWFTKAMGPINGLIDTVYSAFSGNITHDNMVAAYKEISFQTDTTGSTYNVYSGTFDNPIKTKPEMVLLASCTKDEPTHTIPSYPIYLDWIYSGSSISYNIIGLDKSSKYSVKFFVM